MTGKVFLQGQSGCHGSGTVQGQGLCVQPTARLCLAIRSLPTLESGRGHSPGVLSCSCITLIFPRVLPAVTSAATTVDGRPRLDSLTCFILGARPSLLSTLVMSLSPWLSPQLFLYNCPRALPIIGGAQKCLHE